MINVYIGKTREAVLEKALGKGVDKIKKAPSGKPYIENGAFFNLSHSGEVYICAVSEEEVGADIEKISPRDTSRFDKVLSDNEKTLLSKLSGEEKLREFYRIWTGKEARLKLTGEGITKTKLFLTDTTQQDVFTYTEVFDGYVMTIASNASAKINKVLI